MDSNIPSSTFALSVVFDKLVFRIYSSAYLFQDDSNDDEIKSNLEWVKVLWDTGAETSCISDRLARKLGLKDDGFVTVITASSEENVPYYLINLGFANDMKFFDLEVAQFRYGDDDSDFIIGMDIISQGDFSITNFGGQTVFSFRTPSLHSIDYEAELLSQKG